MLFGPRFMSMQAKWISFGTTEGKRKRREWEERRGETEKRKQTPKHVLIVSWKEEAVAGRLILFRTSRFCLLQFTVEVVLRNFPRIALLPNVDQFTMIASRESSSGSNIRVILIKQNAQSNSNSFLALFSRLFGIFPASEKPRVGVPITTKKKTTNHPIEERIIKANDSRFGMNASTDSQRLCHRIFKCLLN